MEENLNNKNINCIVLQKMTLTEEMTTMNFFLITLSFCLASFLALMSPIKNEYLFYAVAGVILLSDIIISFKLLRITYIFAGIGLGIFNASSFVHSNNETMITMSAVFVAILFLAKLFVTKDYINGTIDDYTNAPTVEPVIIEGVKSNDEFLDRLLIERDTAYAAMIDSIKALEVNDKLYNEALSEKNLEKADFLKAVNIEESKNYNAAEQKLLKLVDRIDFFLKFGHYYKPGVAVKRMIR